MDKENLQSGLNWLDLWEMLVPLGEENLITKKRFEIWEDYICELIGGLTCLQPVAGRYRHKVNGEVVTESVAPYRFACNFENLKRIIEFTKIHFDQEEIMVYGISRTVLLM